MRALAVAVGLGVVGGAGYVLSDPEKFRPHFDPSIVPKPKFPVPPPRRQCLAGLQKASTPEGALDVLVVGGGATGTGVALDAVTRGLSVGLVESDDYGSGTSSRSTKLIHGGVRYLEKAILHLDREQFYLVAEALRERAVMIHQAPHLCHALATMIPCYDLINFHKFWIGLKLYDLTSAYFHGAIDFSFVRRPVRCMDAFPKLKYESLLSGIVYYDGHMDDARMCVSIALTAAMHGASVVNHTELKAATVVTDPVSGAQLVKSTLHDALSRKTFDVYSRSVINCGGPLSDEVRKRIGDQRTSHLVPSSGTHVTVDAAYCPKKDALIVPSTDGRVVFAVPWLGSCIMGTTDTPATVTATPRGTREDVTFILKSMEPYMGVVPKRSVKSVWNGIRPLAVHFGGTATRSTKDVVREHLIDVDVEHRSISITGGKWTTYRKMAQDAVDRLLESNLLGRTSSPTPCITEHIRLIGATESDDGEGASTARATLFSQATASIPPEVIHRWQSAFGDRSLAVAQHASNLGRKSPNAATPLATAMAITEAEISYCALQEHCETISDYLMRRSRLAFLNVQEAVSAIPKVADVMAATLGWSKREREARIKEAEEAMIQFTAS